MLLVTYECSVDDSGEELHTSLDFGALRFATVRNRESRGVKGSHHIHTHPAHGGHISVPHPKEDLGAGLVHKILKQAGLSDERSVK